MKIQNPWKLEKDKNIANSNFSQAVLYIYYHECLKVYLHYVRYAKKKLPIYHMTFKIFISKTRFWMDYSLQIVIIYDLWNMILLGNTFCFLEIGRKMIQKARACRHTFRKCVLRTPLFLVLVEGLTKNCFQRKKCILCFNWTKVTLNNSFNSNHLFPLVFSVPILYNANTAKLN